jgi:hypothetical protein
MTAVDWLVSRIAHGGLVSKKQFDELVIEAKAMFEQQIIEAYKQGSEAGYELAKNDDFIEGFQIKEGKEYYEQTFKSE